MAALAAKRTRWLLGANTAVDGYSLMDAIKLVKDCGFPTIEIQPMGRPEATPGKYPGFEFDKLSDSARRDIRKQLRGFQMVTAHLPYTGLDHLTSEDSRRAVETAMNAAEYFGAKMTVLHPQPVADNKLNDAWPQRLELYRRWADRAKKGGLKIAAETGFPRSIRDYVRLIQEVDHPSFGSTIDVGHQAKYAELVARNTREPRAYNDTTIEIIERLGAKVFHLHVHDIDPQTWQEHKPFIHGFVDYPRLFATLSKVNYQGILMFEIGGPASELPRYLREGKAKLEAML